MQVKYLKYRTLDGTEKRMLKQVGSGRIIRLFNKTPYPRQPTDVICPHFINAAFINGCPYDCAWCYLKGTLRFFQRENGRIPIRFKKEKQAIRAVKTFLEIEDLPPTVLNTGELGDSLCAETDFYGKPFSKWIMDFFEGSRHKVLFLTKTTNVNNFLKNDWQKNAILSWSLNAYPVSERWEHLTPHPRDRIEAAKRVFDAGYEVRVRIDPMVAVEGFEGYYRSLVQEIANRLNPTRFTLGCLRGLVSTIARATDKSWYQYLTESSSWGKKPPLESRWSMYKNVINKVHELGLKGDVAVCKDTLEIWAMLKQKFGLDYQKIKCNCIP
jgi:spore photoproduct lyase